MQLVTAMEDERMMHPLLRVPAVDVNPLENALKSAPECRVVLLNGLRTVPAPILPKIVGAGNVYFEIASLEGAGGIANVLQHMPVERLLFGSHVPLFYWESALLKLTESVLTPEQETAIRYGNSRQLIP